MRLRGREWLVLATSTIGVFGALLSPAPADPLTAWPSPTESQTVPVFDMARPEYAPVGAHLGGFLFLPTISETGAYDDNIFASDQRVANDYINTTQEGFTVQSLWAQHSLRGQFFTAQQVYAAHPTEDANTYSGTISGRYDVNSDAFFEFDANVSQQPQLRADPVAVSIAGGQRPIYNDYSPQLTYEQQFGRWNERAQATLEKKAYITTDAASFSYLQPSYRDRVTYSFTDRLGTFFEAGFAQRQWTVNPGRRNFDNFTAEQGIAYQIPTVIDAEIGAGLLRQTYENATFSTLYTPVVEGSVTWNVLPLTTVLANADRTVTGTEIDCLPNSTTCQTSAGLVSVPGTARIGARDTYTETVANLGVQHEIYHNLLGDLQFKYTRAVFEFNDLVDNTYEFDGGGRYLVNRNFTLELDYTHRFRTANLPFDRTFNSGPYNENVVSLNLDAGF